MQRANLPKESRTLPSSESRDGPCESTLIVDGFEYRLHSSRFLTFEEAEKTYTFLQQELRTGTKQSAWTDEETQLLQWVILNYASQCGRRPLQFNTGDWEKISTMLPGRSRLLCRNRWLKTQTVKPNKTLWTEEEDNLLRELVQVHGTKHWTIIANVFSRSFPDKDRKGKQCRDRWLNYLDPEINKAEITVAEKFYLCYNWLQLSNSWVKIAKTMGRTENWVKNNWKKLLKREGISTSLASEDFSLRIVQVMEKLKATGQVPDQPLSVNPNSQPFESSYADVPEELEISDISKSGISETSYGQSQQQPIKGEAPQNPREKLMADLVDRTKQELMKATIQDSESKREEEETKTHHAYEKEGTGGQPMETEGGVRINTDSHRFRRVRLCGQHRGEVWFRRSHGHAGTRCETEQTRNQSL